MELLKKYLKDKKYLLFIDLEGTYKSHEVIAFGAIKTEIDDKGSIIRTEKGIKGYVKAEGKIGRIITDMTGITQEMLNSNGMEPQEFFEYLKFYIGNLEETEIIAFGSFDLVLLLTSAQKCPTPDEEMISYLQHNTFDFGAFMSQFIRDDKNNPLSLLKSLEVFNLESAGLHHDPLVDARDLMSVYKGFLSNKAIVLSYYQRYLHDFAVMPSPIKNIITRLMEGETISPNKLLEEIKSILK